MVKHQHKTRVQEKGGYYKDSEGSRTGKTDAGNGYNLLRILAVLIQVRHGDCFFTLAGATTPYIRLSFMIHLGLKCSKS